MKKKQKQKKQAYVVPKGAAAIIRSAVSLVLGNKKKAATKAGQIKRRFKNRKAASKAMRACFKGCNGKAKAGSRKREIHNAIGYLLSLAFKRKVQGGGKGKTKANRTSDSIVLSLVKLTLAQFTKVIAAARSARKGK